MPVGECRLFWRGEGQIMLYFLPRKYHGFCFYIMMFLLNIFPLQLFIFIWNSMDYFFIVKVRVASSQQVKWPISVPHDVTVNTHCSGTMDRWRCPNNHVTNSLDLSHKIQENLDLLHTIQVLGKHGYFTSKTKYSHKSQDKK